MSAHTPGPWVNDNGLVYGTGMGGASFDIFDASEWNGALEEAHANAALIAAAPDLLAALQDALSGWIYIRQSHGDLYGVGWDRVEQSAKKAIAKATSPNPRMKP